MGKRTESDDIFNLIEEYEENKDIINKASREGALSLIRDIEKDIGVDAITAICRYVDSSLTVEERLKYYPVYILVKGLIKFIESEEE